MEADISTQAVGLASSADFSLVNLFIRADIVVKSVIILLSVVKTVYLTIDRKWHDLRDIW